MNEKKINLEEILQKHLSYSANIIKNTSSSHGFDLWEGINNSMIDFGKQLLKLSAENATVKFSDKQEWSEFHQKYICSLSDEVDEQSILDTIKQVE